MASKSDRHESPKLTRFFPLSFPGSLCSQEMYRTTRDGRKSRPGGSDLADAVRFRPLNVDAGQQGLVQESCGGGWPFEAAAASLLRLVCDEVFRRFGGSGVAPMGQEFVQTESAGAVRVGDHFGLPVFEVCSWVSGLVRNGRCDVLKFTAQRSCAGPEAIDDHADWRRAGS